MVAPRALLPCLRAGLGRARRTGCVRGAVAVRSPAHQYPHQHQHQHARLLTTSSVRCRRDQEVSHSELAQNLFATKPNWAQLLEVLCILACKCTHTTIIMHTRHASDAHADAVTTTVPSRCTCQHACFQSYLVLPALLALCPLPSRLAKLGMAATGVARTCMP